jgi:hypothetical protein
MFQRLIARRFFNRAFFSAVPIAAAFGGRAASAENQPPAVKSGSPIDAMSEFLNGFHFYADDMGRQVEANHFCTHLTEDFHQCVIYDSSKPDAKLIGIEYIVSERIFKNLPDEEKRLWHSHDYEVKSGQLIAPGIPEAAEHAVMMDLITTYGKTWHCWQIDRDPDFPLGIPQLMMGFTREGQANQKMITDRDRRLGVSSGKRRADRADLVMPTIQAGANSWQSGRTVRLKLEEVAVKDLKL